MPLDARARQALERLRAVLDTDGRDLAMLGDAPNVSHTLISLAESIASFVERREADGLFSATATFAAATTEQLVESLERCLGPELNETTDARMLAWQLRHAWRRSRLTTIVLRLTCIARDPTDGPLARSARRLLPDLVRHRHSYRLRSITDEALEFASAPLLALENPWSQLLLSVWPLHRSRETRLPGAVSWSPHSCLPSSVT